MRKKKEMQRRRRPNPATAYPPSIVECIQMSAGWMLPPAPVIWVCHSCRAQLQGANPTIQQMFCPACQRPMEYHGPPRKTDAIDITAEDTGPLQIAAPKDEDS